MPILDHLRRGVDSAKFKTDQLLRINRLQVEIGDIKREIQVTREKIASAVLELHQKGALSHQELENLCAAIDRYNGMITEKEVKIASVRAEQPQQTLSYAVQPANPCPKCRFDVPTGAAFCPNCGAAMPAAVNPETPASIDDAKKCAHCGFRLPLAAEFCPNCGKQVTPES